MTPPPTPMPGAAALLDAFLRTTNDDIIPLTEAGVARGCKIFGAAILRKSDLSLVVAASNNETASPLLHGETHCIQQFWAMDPAERPDVKECVFFATHEPCSLCLSAITWSGFDNFTHMFTYEDTRTMFAIPHDIRILEEVYRVRAAGESDEELARRPLYNRRNAYWTARSLDDLVAELPAGERVAAQKRIADVKKRYEALSETYQRDKGSKGIPLA